MSVSFNPGVNPDEYAKTYAAQNNMSVEDAKVALKEKYGDPQKPQDVSVWTTEQDGEDVSAEDQMLKIDPNFIAQLYADQQGMTIDEAIADLEKKLGIPSEESLGDTVKNFIQNLIGMVKDKGDELPDQGVDPDTYAQQYADENGITLDEAKAELSAKHGDPVKPDEEGKEDKTAVTADLPDPGIDPDAYAQQYADTKGITLEEAKAELSAKYGDPVKPDEEGKEDKTAVTADLPDPGIDPDAYAQQYADAKGITLEEAKAELSAKHGAPVQPDKNDNEAQKPQFDKNQDPDFYVRLYAAENNITYEEAKAYFESTYGAFN